MKNIDKILIESALKKKKAEKIIEEFEYIRFREEYKKIPRGTVIINNQIFFGYPHIKRVFNLKKGIERNIKSNYFFIEQKVDGLNIRVVKINGSIYAFSRGGLLDHFATEKIRELNFDKFFLENPNHIICGEMIGNTPYTKASDEFDIKFYIFDIENGNGEYLGVKKRQQLIEKYGFLAVPFLGEFTKTDYEQIKIIIIKLNHENCEGIVIKSPDRLETIKYVTSSSDLSDIAETSDKFFDMPIGFFYQRIIRSFLFSKEIEVEINQEQKIGQAFVKGLNLAVQRIEKGIEINEEFTIYIKDEKIFENIKKHMSKEVKIEEISRQIIGDKTKIKFRKIYKKTNKILKSYLNGKAIED